eukprot:scaffold435_cov275-Chaetoceros_neogracile.AAC.94
MGRAENQDNCLKLIDQQAKRFILSLRSLKSSREWGSLTPLFLELADDNFISSRPTLGCLLPPCTCPLF